VARVSTDLPSTSGCGWMPAAVGESLTCVTCGSWCFAPRWAAVRPVAACVVIAQMAAFFTMARRSEAQEFLAHGQANRVAALVYQPGTPQNAERVAAASKDEGLSTTRINHSNFWRLIGLSFFAASLITFAIGCAWGAKTIMVAKEKAAAIDVAK
jgi:hypothetical protein